MMTNLNTSDAPPLLPPPAAVNVAPGRIRATPRWLPWLISGVTGLLLVGALAGLAVALLMQARLRVELSEAADLLLQTETVLTEVEHAHAEAAADRDACAAQAGIYQEIILLLVDEIDANAADPRDPIDTTVSASYATAAASLPCLVVTR